MEPIFNQPTFTPKRELMPYWDKLLLMGDFHKKKVFSCHVIDKFSLDIEYPF
jgi:hypothetical protein